MNVLKKYRINTSMKFRMLFSVFLSVLSLENEQNHHLLIKFSLFCPCECCCAVLGGEGGHSAGWAVIAVNLSLVPLWPAVKIAQIYSFCFSFASETERFTQRAAACETSDRKIIATSIYPLMLSSEWESLCLSLLLSVSLSLPLLSHLPNSSLFQTDCQKSFYGIFVPFAERGFNCRV